MERSANDDPGTQTGRSSVLFVGHRRSSMSAFRHCRPLAQVQTAAGSPSSTIVLTARNEKRSGARAAAAPPSVPCRSNSSHPSEVAPRVPRGTVGGASPPRHPTSRLTSRRRDNNPDGRPSAQLNSAQLNSAQLNSVCPVGPTTPAYISQDDRQRLTECSTWNRRLRRSVCAYVVRMPLSNSTITTTEDRSVFQRTRAPRRTRDGTGPVRVSAK